MGVTIFYQHVSKETIRGKCSLDEWIAFKSRPRGIGRLYKEIGRQETADEIVQPQRAADFTQEVRGFVPPEALEAVRALTEPESEPVQDTEPNTEPEPEKESGKRSRKKVE